MKGRIIPILLSLVLAACQSTATPEPVEKIETIEKSTVTAHFMVKYLSGMEDEISKETVNVELHRNNLDDDCFMSMPGETEAAMNPDDIDLNIKANQIMDFANTNLAQYGSSPFSFAIDQALILQEYCDTTDVYARVYLEVSHDELAGGFLKKSFEAEHQSAYIYLPTAFYDAMLRQSAVEDSANWDFVYPTITEVGGYIIQPNDPNSVAAWLTNQKAFLEKVYGRSTEIVAAPGVITYQSRTMETRITGYGCLNRNYKGVCTDRGAFKEKYYEYHDHELEATIGTLLLK
jgi:hypothetical protein